MPSQFREMIEKANVFSCFPKAVLCGFETKWMLAIGFPQVNSSPLDKMADISRRHFQKFSILIKISLKFFPKGPVDNNPAIV